MNEWRDECVGEWVIDRVSQHVCECVCVCGGGCVYTLDAGYPSVCWLWVQSVSQYERHLPWATSITRSHRDTQGRFTQAQAAEHRQKQGITHTHTHPIMHGLTLGFSVWCCLWSHSYIHTHTCLLKRVPLHSGALYFYMPSGALCKAVTH